MKCYIPPFILVCLLGCIKQDEGYLEQKYLLDEVFEIVEEHSINRDSIDFPQLKLNAYAKLQNAESLEDCYPIIRSILKNLNDHHSFFMPREQVKQWKSTSKTSGDSDLITFRGKLLRSDVGYIHMKGFGSGDPISINNFADSLQQLIKSIDNHKIIGWILDLRENSGGNCWPMLAGLGPLLGDGVCGYFIDNNQNQFSWFYRAGAAGIDSAVLVKVRNQPYELLDSKNLIAVLTGPKTVSSGEVVVTAFKHKINTKSFGDNTGGLSTGNASYQLSDGSMINLTTSVYADRLGNQYGKKIEPDETVKFSYENIGDPSDPVVESALGWIYGKQFWMLCLMVPVIESAACLE